MTRRLTLAAVLLLSGCGMPAGPAAPEPSRALEEQVDAIFARYDSTTTPGCAVAVMQDGEVILKKAYGMANISLGVPMTTATSSWIPYSEARVFVSLAVAMLARDGAISLDDPIARHVPEVPSYAADVRIRQLVHHTSGLADYGVLAGVAFTVGDRMSEDEFFRMLARWGRLNFEPGSDVMYSNTDYALLKILVERASGGSLHAYLDEQLFRPLGMRSTRVGADQGDVFPGHALFQQRGDNGYGAVLRYRISPVGGISVTTSLDDVVIWERALRENALGIDALFADLRQGAPASEEGFAFGIYPGTRDGVVLEEHRGISGYPYLTRAPQAGVSVATICNAYPGMWEFGPAVAVLYARPAAAAGATAAGAPAPVEPSPVVPMSAAELERYAGEYRGTGGPSLRLAVVDDTLRINSQNGVFDARPVGVDTFEVLFPPSYVLRVVFEGADSAMTLTTTDASTGEPDGPVLRRWIPPQPPTAEALRSYPGRYAGDDVDETLHITVSGERILVGARGLAEAQLEPTSVADRFYLNVEGTSYYVMFGREGSGEVTHLTVDAVRVKGMRYTRSERQ